MEKFQLKNLPEHIKVRIHFEPGEGFTAEVLDFPGCITEADTIRALSEMINHAVISYFDIPEKYHDMVGYVPDPQSYEKMISVIEEKKGISLRAPEFFSFHNVDSSQSC